MAGDAPEAAQAADIHDELQKTRRRDFIKGIVNRYHSHNMYKTGLKLLFVFGTGSDDATMITNAPGGSEDQTWLKAKVRTWKKVQPATVNMLAYSCPPIHNSH